MSYLDRLEDRLERVSRYSNYLLALCPFHDDNNPSFFVYEDFYICKSCGKKGKPEDLLRLLDKNFRPRPDRINYSNPFTQWLRELDLIELCNRSASLLEKLPHMGSYLHNRGLRHDILKNLDVGYRDGWYIFPIISAKGKVIGAVARNSDTKSTRRYMTPAGQTAMLYCPNWSRLLASRNVVLVYGILDAVSLESIGIPSVTGTLGKRLDPELLKDIRKNIYIIPDNGEEKEAYTLASQLGWRSKCLTIKYPVGTKDINDLLVKYPKKLRNILEEITR